MQCDPKTVTAQPPLATLAISKVVEPCLTQGSFRITIGTVPLNAHFCQVYTLLWLLSILDGYSVHKKGAT